MSAEPIARSGLGRALSRTARASGVTRIIDLFAKRARAAGPGAGLRGGSSRSTFPSRAGPSRASKPCSTWFMPSGIEAARAQMFAGETDQRVARGGRCCTRRCALRSASDFKAAGRAGVARDRGGPCRHARPGRQGPQRGADQGHRAPSASAARTSGPGWSGGAEAGLARRSSCASPPMSIRTRRRRPWPGSTPEAHPGGRRLQDLHHPGDPGQR